LWELPWGMSVAEREGLRVIAPRMSVDVLRPALAELVEGGYAVLWQGEAGDAECDLESALAAIRDERNWLPQAESNQPFVYSVSLTEMGEAEYRSEHFAT